MTLTIRDAGPDDAAAIADIYNHAVATTTATFDTAGVTPEDRRVWLTGRSALHPVIVAERRGAVVGWAALAPWSKRCAYEWTVELSVYVAEDARGAGVGSALVEDILERAARAGVHAVIAQVTSENDTSMRLMRRAGLAEVGRLREVGEKFGRLLDVVLWERVLG